MAQEQSVSVAEGLRRLRLFNEKAERLSRTRFIKMTSGEGVGVRVSLRADQPLTVEKGGADEEATDALLLTLRSFLQPRDGIQLEQIEQLYRVLPVPGDCHVKLSAPLAKLNEVIDRATPVALDGEPITGRMILETFVYGNHAHANDDKRVMYEKWRSGPLCLWFEGYFEWLAGAVINFVFWLSRMNAQAITFLEGTHE